MKIDWVLVIKIFGGMVIVPVCIAAMYLWPWWQKRGVWGRILTAPVILPVTLLALLFSGWYGNL
jgi:hypothetical protein